MASLLRRIVVPIYRCYRCGYEWLPKVDVRTGRANYPKECVKCKRKDWDKEEVRGRGRPKGWRKYGLTESS